MDFITDYLAGNPLVAIFLCLGIGCIIGKIKIAGFTLGATASTLIVAMAVSIWVGAGQIVIDSGLKTAFSQCSLLPWALRWDPHFSRLSVHRESGL